MKASILHLRIELKEVSQFPIDLLGIRQYHIACYVILIQ